MNKYFSLIVVYLGLASCVPVVYRDLYASFEQTTGIELESESKYEYVLKNDIFSIKIVPDESKLAIFETKSSSGEVLKIRVVHPENIEPFSRCTFVVDLPDESGKQYLHFQSDRSECSEKGEKSVVVEIYNGQKIVANTTLKFVFVRGGYSIGYDAI